jgi:hypothetical protein
VQEAFIGTWARESHLSIEHLNSIRDLNHRFLDLTEQLANGWPDGRAGCTSGLGSLVAPLSASQRAAVANCPYALFDLRFSDDAYWQDRLGGGNSSVADEACIDETSLDFVRLALFYAWHVASGAALAARLLFGMRSSTAAAFRRITVDVLPSLTAAEARNLTARWSDCHTYWAALLGAAAREDLPALRRMQLSGLQLAAASFAYS